MRQSGAPVHAYYLSYVAADRRGRQPGAAHADDIPFVMGTLDAETSLARVTERDRAVSTLMTDYWVQFAKTGSPNGPGLPDWPAWDTDRARVLEIGDEILVRDGFLAERMEYHLERGQALLNQSR
jgi:carboxylesterase type B